jgi:hypothetical protein
MKRKTISKELLKIDTIRMIKKVKQMARIMALTKKKSTMRKFLQ